MMVKLKLIKLVSNNWFTSIIVGVLLFTPTILLGQENLIFNPNCDMYDTCPDNMGQIERASGWWKYDSFGTPDYLNVCASHPKVGIPSDIGYQLPLSGSGYFHLSILNSFNPQNFLIWDGQEYIQSRESLLGTLKKPLRKVPHLIEFYVNFSNLGYLDGFGGGEGRIATNAIDFILLKSNQEVYNSVIPYINSSEIVNMNKNNEILNDTLSWIKLSACFVPSGSEKYFAIGAFRDTTEILLEFSGASYSNIHFSSYYFDNFAIYECDTCCLGEFPYEDHVNVASNPGSVQNPTTFSVLLNPNTTGILSVYDSAGRLVAKEEFSQLLTTYTLPVLANGVYHYALTTSNGVKDVGKVLVVD
jgi:hypothetical protein